MDYLNLLKHSYIQCRLMDENLSKFDFLAQNIFDFITYENKISSFLAKKCLEVCNAISSKSTFDYIKEENNHLWYLVMVNMPFFKNKLDWGTSIRGAWWRNYGESKFKIESCGLYIEQDQLLEILFNEKEWIEFIDAMDVFTNETN